MSDRNGTTFDHLIADNSTIEVALQRAGREAALTHAKLGRSIPTWRDGQVVWITPAEIFARYGLDENGKPKAE